MSVDRRAFSAGAAALAGVGVVSSLAQAAQAAITSSARSLWRRSIVLDCNIGPQFSQTTFPLPQADLDIARASGLTALKTSIGGFNASFEDTIAEIGFYQRVFEAHPASYLQVRTIADLATAKRTGKLGVIFGFENAACLEDKVDRIELFRFLGVRVMQLSYNLTSPFGAGVLAPADATLTELGRQAVAKMNDLGVALDLSHANAATTAAAMAVSRKPVIMTHAGCAAIHPHPRNKADDQLRALAAKGGVFGIYDLPYLTASPRQPALDDYMAHMTHALAIMGEDHVGIGSDTSFGAIDHSPQSQAAFEEAERQRHAAGVAAPEEDRMTYVEGLNQADRSLIIADALLKRGYPARVAEKVLGANFVRVLGEIW